MTVWEGIGLTALIFIAYIFHPIGGLKSLIDRMKEEEKREKEEREREGNPPRE